MADLHKAIRSIHNDVVSINGDTQETINAWDKDGNEISINWTDVNAWTDPEEYKYKIWLEVEIAASQAMEKIGQIPKGVSSIVRKKGKIKIQKSLSVYFIPSLHCNRIFYIYKNICNFLLKNLSKLCKKSNCKFCNFVIIVNGT